VSVASGTDLRNGAPSIKSLKHVETVGPAHAGIEQAVIALGREQLLPLPLAHLTRATGVQSRQCASATITDLGTRFRPTDRNCKGESSPASIC
jgi:hypothetical protein